MTSTTLAANVLANISSKTNTGGIVGGVLGGVIVLIIAIALFCYCVLGCRCSKPPAEVAERARDMENGRAGVLEPYGDSTNNPMFVEAQYAVADPKRVEVYDNGFLPGGAEHALRDARRQSQNLADDNDYASVI